MYTSVRCTMWYVTSTGRDQLLRAVIEHFVEHGVTNQSLRGLAAAIGTSHRMLIYHFGSREGLLADVVAEIEAQQRDALGALARTDEPDVRETVLRFWSHVSNEARRYGPIFFELAAHAMQGHTHAAQLRTTLVEPWLEPLTRLLVEAGIDPHEARVRARLGLGTARGLLHDALVTGDFETADAAMTAFTDLLLSESPATSTPSPDRR